MHICMHFISHILMYRVPGGNISAREHGDPRLQWPNQNFAWWSGYKCRPAISVCRSYIRQESWRHRRCKQLCGMRSLWGMSPVPKFPSFRHSTHDASAMAKVYSLSEISLPFSQYMFTDILTPNLADVPIPHTISFITKKVTRICKS